MSAPEARPMTKGEREELKRLARERARVAKADAHRRSADLAAAFEQELLTIYDYNRDDLWRQAVQDAEAAVKVAQEKIARRCEELGIPAAFAPTVSFDDAAAVCEVIALTVGLGEGAVDLDEGLDHLRETGTDERALEATGKALAAVGVGAAGALGEASDDLDVGEDEGAERL